MKGHELRLQVGSGSPGTASVTISTARIGPAVGADEAGSGLDAHAGFAELVEEGREVRRVAMGARSRRRR
jgi:hypothetical protein